MLAGSLPIERSRSNVEATLEVNENSIDPFAAGHSVWFAWEATLTGWVTVGTCESDFATVLGVYVGTALGDLTKVADGSDSEGPHCPNGQREYTFKATSGADYAIAVDGDSFFLPPASPPSGEGSFALRIESRPPPSNDDFQEAVTLEGKTTEEPGGDRFHFAPAFGFNWGATKETGEPSHAGDPGGASVWYSWTAPGSGVARIGACCSAWQLFGVYTGSSVDGLTQHEPTFDPPLGNSFSVKVGTTYRIAIDGKFDAGAVAAEMGGFTLNVSMQLPSLPKSAAVTPSFNSAGSVPPKDTEPPETFIHRKVLKSKPPTIVIRFSSSELGSTFRCRHNKGAFIPCRAPITNRGRRPGRHRFEIAAVDAAGNVDLSPAITRFYVPQPNRRPKPS